MPHALAQAVEVVTTVMAVAGMGYFLAAILAANIFLFKRRAPLPAPMAPGNDDHSIGLPRQQGGQFLEIVAVSLERLGFCFARRLNRFRSIA